MKKENISFAPRVKICSETTQYTTCVDLLNQCVFGPGRFTKAAHLLREGGVHDQQRSLIALYEDKLVGSLRMTPVKIGKNKYFFLGPLVVDPKYQGHKIGTKLMELALKKNQSCKREGVILIGDEAYYKRFGFQKTPFSIFMPAPVDPLRCLFFPFLNAKEETEEEIFYPSGTIYYDGS